MQHLYFIGLLFHLRPHFVQQFPVSFIRILLLLFDQLQRTLIDNSLTTSL